jgi:hypothetical protein
LRVSVCRLGLFMVGGPQPVQNFAVSPGQGYGFLTMDADGRVIGVDVPTDAVSAKTVITYLPGYANGVPISTDILFFGDYAFTLLPEPHDAELLTPVTLSIDYGEDVVLAVQNDESRLALYWWDGAEWHDAATTCATPSAYERLPELNRLRLPVCKLGFFLLVAP